MPCTMSHKQLYPVRILRLNASGFPLAWLTREEAATLIVKGMVLWEFGDQSLQIRGGVQRCGQQSELRIPSIIATAGAVVPQKTSVLVPSVLLYRRDQHTCLYCARVFAESDLTRDHVLAKSRGGKDTWNNLVTACRRCNQRKGSRLPEEAGMSLIAVPFMPNPTEILALANRYLLAEQQAYLASGFSKNMQVRKHFAVQAP